MTTPFNKERGSPLKFFLLVFAFSIPLWLIGAVTPLQLLPGLPVSSLMAFCPLIAASILVYREDKTTGVTELLKRSFDYGRIRAKVWYVPTVLLMPGMLTDLQHGSPGNVSPWWHHGSFLSGSTTTRARAYLSWLCVTP